ncbi:MAG: amidohydrolase family protein [Gemmatimonadales bacterium]|nr:amidohydrolase family protein [Gemmatimonadales bacterium]NIN13086.1 amidohydrolase family protein [Gemmatimonadales bacterium]NIN51170.1 amidohydrolase family protein [Gemmatimonadales bacterium]NIP08634.1 amidohydrolase family protein [Gemmatimonadales bacterium]NIR02322.1 amidohydrolase family protein [Gemmatimonadales bacterium]
MRRILSILTTTLVALTASLCVTAVNARQAESQIRVLVNGRIWTGDVARPWAEAVALQDGRILAVGDRAQVVRAAGSDARQEDLAGRFVTPGFIDTHTHFARAGELLLGVNLLDVSDDTGLRRRVGEAGDRLPPGSWMVGGDWGAYDLESDWAPRRSVLDSLTGDRPALLNKWDRSQFVANAAALAAAGIDPATHDGLLSREEAGRIYRAMPRPSFEQRLAEARLGLWDLVRHGVTTIHDITGAGAMRTYQYLKARDSLTVRVCARPTLDHWEDLAAVGIVTGYGDEVLSICGLKGFVDGIMGNSSAMFREPYRHMPDTRGRWRTMMSPPGNMERLIGSADSAGLTPQIHAIGDLAVDTLLDMFADAIEQNGPRDRRLRMIHAQVVEADDFRRFGELGIIAEVQPYHAIDDMRWMEDRIGSRSRGAYAFRSLKNGGALLVFGSDWPGTNAAWYPADPVLGIYAAVTRKTLDGKPEGGWYPDERVTVQEALEAYTVDAAYAAFEEDWKGKLAPGYVADLVVLSEDLFAIAPDAIKDVRVLRTMVSGRWVYSAEALSP